MTSTSSERVLPVARHTGERVHAIIWSQRLKQGSVARAVGVSPSTFSKKLRGEVPITVDELMAIAGVLGVDPGDLLPRLDSNQQPSGYLSLQVSGPPDVRPPGQLDGKDPPSLRLVHNSPTVVRQRAADVGDHDGVLGQLGKAAARARARGLLRVE